MTGKDFLKLLLISYGFTKIKIETYRGHDNFQGYTIHASNDEGEEYYEENCEGLMFNISNINYTMKCKGIEPVFDNFNGGEYTIKELLNMFG